MTDRRQVWLPNFRNDEGACECGCRAVPSDELMTCVQALIYALTRKYGNAVQCRITGGSRCPKHDDDVQAAVARAGGKPSTDSQHRHNAAIDCTFWIRQQGGWAQISNDIIAGVAIASGLFGGVGLNTYKRQGLNLVHLDVRHAGGTVATW